MYLHVGCQGYAMAHCVMRTSCGVNFGVKYFFCRLGVDVSTTNSVVMITLVVHVHHLPAHRLEGKRLRHRACSVRVFVLFLEA